jgi:hypothetical protein
VLDKMVGCAAFGCTSRNTKHEKGVGFFSFPKDAVRCRKWTGQLNRAHYVVNVNSRLCSKHFEKEQFVGRCVLAESVGFTGKFNQRLKPDAVPTIFYRSGQMSPRKPRSSAASIREKKLKIQVTISFCPF